MKGRRRDKEASSKCRAVEGGRRDKTRLRAACKSTSLMLLILVFVLPLFMYRILSIWFFLSNTWSSIRWYRVSHANKQKTTDVWEQEDTCTWTSLDKSLLIQVKRQLISHLGYIWLEIVYVQSFRLAPWNCSFTIVTSCSLKCCIFHFRNLAQF